MIITHSTEKSGKMQALFWEYLEILRMKVLKFGGTSVGSPQAINRIIAILKDQDHKGKVPAVVVSAFSGVTDTLIGMAYSAVGKTAGNGSYREMLEDLTARHRATAAHFLKNADRKSAFAEINALIEELKRVLEGINLLAELSPRTLDLVMSFGERLSAGIIAHACTANGIAAAFLDARTLIRANDRFGNAQYLPAETFAAIRSFFKHPQGGSQGGKLPLQIVTGFIASTTDGQTVTLGRGGSDLTAAIFGAAMKAELVEIWTDVDGIYTANPQIVPNALMIDEISYAEAMEISHFGAKVLFPPTVRPALEQDIPIAIRNTFNPASSGTRITRKAPQGEFPIRGISSMDHIALVRLQGPGMVGVAGFSARVFGALARRRISVILITQSSSE